MGKWRYGIVLDAGSSGTRIYIYQWLKAQKARDKASKKNLGRLPELKIEDEWVDKIKPGVSTFGDKPERVGQDHLQQLFDHAYKYIPKDEVENTPLFLLATAGMRLLEDHKRKALLKEICAYSRANTKFQLPDCDLHIQVIPGETEGLYGWIAANYLLGGFDKPEKHDHGGDHHTYGFLDMGGASAQIAFAPNSTETAKHANDLQLLRMRNVDGTADEYKVFVTTWLGFGVNEARRRYLEALIEASPSDALELPDPCTPKGLTVTTKGKAIEPGSAEYKGEKVHVVGTGKFTECVSKAYPLLDKDAPCEDPPCLLNGVHVPAIDFDVNHFVGVSEYWHTTHEIFEFGHKDKAYDWHTYQERVTDFCSKDWKDIKKGVADHTWGKKVKEETTAEVCFKASWIINVLHDGIGLPRIGHENMDGAHNGTKEVLDKAKQKGFLDTFQAVNKIDHKELSWTLGKMVLYASSEIPPSEDLLLPVGFGTNTIFGQPKDFQPAGGIPLLSSPVDSDDSDDWHDKLFLDSPRRIPGVIIFVLIVLILGYILYGRERRAAVMARFKRVLPGSSSHGRRRKGPHPLNLASKLFGSAHASSGPAYERVLEDGDAAQDFELPEIHSDGEASDSSDGTSVRLGRTSGWATPQLKPGGFDHHSLAAAGSSYFDTMPGSTSGGMHPPPTPVGNAISRGGLMARVDSRDRLHVADDAHGVRKGKSRSRASSPGRALKMGSLKET